MEYSVPLEPPEASCYRSSWMPYPSITSEVYHQYRDMISSEELLASFMFELFRAHPCGASLRRPWWCACILLQACQSRWPELRELSWLLEW